MKNSAILAAVCAFGLCAGAQDKPRVFVQGKGSENLATSGSVAGGQHWATWGSRSTLDSHDEGMEVTKDLQKNCSGVTVTLNQSNADYIVMLNRESKHNRGLLRTNSQVQVANRAGDILGTNSTRTVGNAAKDACELVLADWQAHGRLNAPASGSSSISPAPIPTPVPSPAPSQTPPDQPPQQATAQAQQVITPSPKADQAQPVVAGSTTDNAIGTASGSQSLGEAARLQKQHRACLELAKDNPSITCK